MTARPQQPSWSCPNCRTDNFGSQPNCLRCGAARPAPQPASPQQYAPPPQPPVYQQPPPASYYPPDARHPASSRPGWLLPCLALSALGLFLACTVAGGAYLFRQPLQAWLAGGQPQAAAPLPPSTTPVSTQALPQATAPIGATAPTGATAPAAAPTATQPAPLPTSTPDYPRVSFEGISFRYPPQLASGVLPILAEASNEPGWVMPALYEFDFYGYAHPAGVFSPNIIVIPVQEYRLLDPSADEQIPWLQTILAQSRADPAGSLPLLPVMMAAQLIRAHVEIVPFQDGSGLRYLTQLAQDAWPINNEDLFYTFQGLTSDGSYYISAIFPVSHPDLPATGADYAMGDYLQFSENFEEYAESVAESLNHAAPASFTPNLDWLDEVIRSLQIER